LTFDLYINELKLAKSFNFGRSSHF